MWRNAKALEEENKRLRKELEEWVKKALELSKRLHNLAKKDKWEYRDQHHMLKQVHTDTL